MANANSTTTTKPAAVAQVNTTPMAFIAPVVGWLVPGAGHLIQKRWGRGLLLMAAVFTMFFAGLAMQGKIYGFNTGDLLDILGFFGDIGTGALYIISRGMDLGHGAVHRAIADYGTKYIIVAGLLNIVCAVDAYHIAIGKKK